MRQLDCPCQVGYVNAMLVLTAGDACMQRIPTMRIWQFSNKVISLRDNSQVLLEWLLAHENSMIYVLRLS